MLRGVDPLTTLRTTSALERQLLDRAAVRASELRQAELDYLAHKIAAALAGKG